jgi:tripartite-type tricarboxylate transporter receptor subunit TctC
MPNAQPAIARLHRELVQIISSKEFVDGFEALGFEIRTSTPDQLAAFAAVDTAEAINVRLD